MEELSADAREILSEMRQADAPRTGARDRVRRQLALSVGGAASLSIVSTAAAARSAALLGQAGAGAATVGAGTAASGTLAGVSIAKLSLLVLLGAAGGGALLTPLALLSEAPHTQPKSLEARRVLPAAPASRSRAPVPLPQQAPPDVSDADRGASARARIAPQVTRSLAPQAEPRANGSLASETRLLEEVRERLRAGRAAEGMVLLEQHARQYPNGALREEALASRVFALSALGRVNEAHRAGASFHATFPRSPLGPRVDRALSAP